LGSDSNSGQFCSRSTTPLHRNWTLAPISGVGLKVIFGNKLLIKPMNKTPIDDPIASLELLWIHKDGRETLISAKVGRPYKFNDISWACPCELLGVDGRYPDMRGLGSMQALGISLSLIKARLGHLLEKDENLCFADERENRLDQAFLESTFGK
jgi:hypothetical protein